MVSIKDSRNKIIELFSLSFSSISPQGGLQLPR